MKTPMLGVIAAGALALSFAGVDEIAVLVIGAVAPLVVETVRRRPAKLPVVAGTTGAAAVSVSSVAAAVAAGAASVTLSTLFFTFLKIGSVLYGSGYVLLAFLRHDFVERLGWLTDQQLLDAVAIGQFTPGPVFTTATFIGYVVAGWSGAALATLGIFLPSFVFVAASHPLIPRIRGSRRAAALLDGVNVAALALMAAVTVDLARSAVVDALTAIIAAGAAIALLKFRLNSAWLIVAGGAAGIAYRLMAG